MIGSCEDKKVYDMSIVQDLLTIIFALAFESGFSSPHKL